MTAPSLARTRFRSSILRTAVPVALALTLACTPETPAELDAGSDAPPSDTGVDAPRAPDVCDELGLPRALFVSSGGGDGPGALATDFTVETTQGTYSFSESFSGCETYVFFLHVAGARDLTGVSYDDIIRTAPDRVLTDGARNVQYFYLSTEPDAATRAALMADRESFVEGSLALQLATEEERAFWRPRFHYVTDRADEITGSIGDYVRRALALATDPSAAVMIDASRTYPVPRPHAFGIDRAQRFDAVDSLTPSVAQPAELGMAAYLGHFYNYVYELDARQAAETDAEVVTLLDETTTGRVFVRDASLPALAATADSLEVDVRIACTAENPFACSEWDRIALVSYCVDGTACTERREIARWITPYWRRGVQRYAIDASPMLALLRAGGTASFRIELGPEWERATEWEARVSLRFRDTGGPRAFGIVPAFAGGTFDGTYNGRPPVSFTPPAGTSRVELVTILSGHGQVSGNNCAEWCDHRHTFSVDGVALPTVMHAGMAIGSPLGCAVHARDGAIPGQWGNWAPGRAYWCPGLAVEAGRIDITSMVAAGTASELTYEGTYRTSPPAGGDIALSSYVVYYEAP